MIILIAISTFVFTLLGGLFALKLKDKLHLILGFSAGAVVAVAFFDLLPEALDLGSKFYEPGTIIAVAALGFLVYLVLDRLIFLHAHSHSGHEGHDCEHDHSAGETEKVNRRGMLGASSLSLHSFLDGVAIGLAFQVSAAIGTIVVVAVLTHDFSDGINTVNLILRHRNTDRVTANSDITGMDWKNEPAFKWLLADAVAPVLGVVATMFFSVPEQGLSIILAIFSGFFLYIGASDLIPESHHAHPKFLTTVMTLFGAAVLCVAVRFAGL